jgi:hypothetical protein
MLINKLKENKMYNEGSNDLDGIIDLVTLIKSSLKKNSDAVTELQKQVNVQQRTIDTLIKRCVNS